MPAPRRNDTIQLGAGTPSRHNIPSSLPQPPAWMLNAACASVDPEIFFPESGQNTRQARKVCAGCDVQTECATYAIATDTRFGIWGALDPTERGRLRTSTCHTCGTPTPGRNTYCDPHRPTPKRARGSQAAIRAWARKEGHRVSSRGQLPASLIDKYLAAHPGTVLRDEEPA